MKHCYKLMPSDASFRPGKDEQPLKWSGRVEIFTGEKIPSIYRTPLKLKLNQEPGIKKIFCVFTVAVQKKDLQDFRNLTGL